MQPQNIPNTGLLATCREPTLNPHMLGKNCEYIIMHITAPCAANNQSLKRTVVSGELGWRAAYCALMAGER
jgi:hypothetical protein